MLDQMNSDQQIFPSSPDSNEPSVEEQLSTLLRLHAVIQELNTTRDINSVLRITLEAVLANTEATAGTIGIIDKSFNQLSDIYQVQPGGVQNSKLSQVSMKQVEGIDRSIAEPLLIDSASLCAVFNIPEELHFHFFDLARLDEGYHALLCLHVRSANVVTPLDRYFIKLFKEQAGNAINNAILYFKLHDVIQTKNEFISFVSHELKSPLTVIKGYADILQKEMAGQISEEQKDFLITISHNVHRMNKIISDLADQSHIETQSLRIEFVSTPVEEVINEVLQSYRAEIEKKSLEIKKEIHRPIENAWCDRLRLVQILSNLVSNAVKYSPENAMITIGAQHCPNQWDRHGAAEVIHFWVEDHGYGITLQDQAHLFEKFYRGTDARKLKLPGSGLGLRITKSLVEMMGGRMWFESTPGEGSTFHFTMPI